MESSPLRTASANQRRRGGYCGAAQPQGRQCRYGLEDFEEIARALAKPLCEFGTSQTLLVAFWNAALAYVAAEATDRLEFLSLGVVHFVCGLTSDSAESVLGLLENEAVDTVRSIPLTGLLGISQTSCGCMCLVSSDPQGKGTDVYFGMQATQGLAEAVAGSDLMEACMEALRGKAAKKPMPSALKKKGGAKGGARKKARFEGDDSDGGSPGDGGAVGPAVQPKAKVPSTKENVKKLIGSGGGWMKRRAAAAEEEEEEAEDEIEDSGVRHRCGTTSLVSHHICASATNASGCRALWQDCAY